MSLGNNSSLLLIKGCSCIQGRTLLGWGKSPRVYDSATTGECLQKWCRSDSPILRNGNSLSFSDW